MRKYAVVIERGANNYSAYVPDLPGCVTTGKTIEEIKTNIREAIELHLEGLIEDGATVPEPNSVAIEVELPVQPSPA
jgi:predicted RNase H-like HicB family nuclease